MKKIALVLVAAMVLVFTGCEKKETISMPFDVADVNNIEMYRNVVPNSAEKQVITKTDDIEDMVDAEGLSKETLEWLDWYNSLPEEQQLAVSAVPPDLLEESGLVKTEDAEVSAQEDELCGYPLAPEEVE